jgi:gliding motility-associated-like protein
MKRFKNISEFEKLVKDQLENHSSPPPSSIIENFDFSSLKQPSAKTAKIIELIKNPIQAIKIASIVGASATMLFFALENENTPTKGIKSSMPEETYTSAVDSTVNLQNTESIKKELTDIPEEFKIVKNDTTNSLIQPLQPENIPETESPISTKVVEDKSSNANNYTPENIVVSNANPCIGEVITLKSKTKGDWYINNQILSRNTDHIEYKSDSDQPISIDFENEYGETREVIKGFNNGYQIITKKINPTEYSFSINNQEAENTNKCQLKEKQVGEHIIKTVPINVPCAKESEATFQVKGTGSIKFFNVFTPNGDGTNDEYPVEIKNYETYQILIYDQIKNQVVFRSNNPNNRWNGSVDNQGENCPPGEYLAKINYTLNGEKAQTKNIKFTLIRP